jgi:arabinose-5-phosphate isomerase
MSISATPRTTTPDLDAARETLRLESDALLAQADLLGENFSAVLDLIQNLKGRLLVGGMGKAGHVGKKIVATLASTGTPASFVHPAEASHGDLGMITENDAVLLISKSGESTELRDLINYCKRFGIPLIAMTANPNSALGRQADHILQLVEMAEACPHQQAPTTSTIMMMGLGDAVAITLMKRRGFSATDFRQYHPGGKLGGQLLAVANVMHKTEVLPLISEGAMVSEAQAVMTERNFGCAIVTDPNGNLAGIVTDGDLRRHLSPTLPTLSVAKIMGRNPRTIAHDALCSAAIAVMNQHNITQLIVTDGKKPVGLIRLHDILRAGVA